MEILEQISRQRVKHIVTSYQLDGDETNQFETYLEELLHLHPIPLIELALVETLIDSWLTIPMTRGVEFLSQTHDKLKQWEQESIVSTITPAQFQQITGLDPSPIFGPTGPAPTCPIVKPS